MFPLRDVRRNPWPLILLVLGQVATTFYVYGALLARPGSTIAPPVPLYPPQAIVLAVLLLTPRRTWWLYLLVSYLIRVGSNILGGYPLWFALQAQVVNGVEPLVGALLVTRFLPGTLRFARLREVSVYALCVSAASVLAATLGAAVRTLAGNPFWPSWWAWFRGDVLASLLLAPLILLWVGARRAELPASHPPGHRGEAALLAVALVLVGGLMVGIQAPTPETAAALLYVPIPFLVWAAVRFGPRGLASVLGLLTVCAVPAVANGLGPFTVPSPAANLLTLQLFLFGIGVPLFFVAAVVRERQEAQLALAQRTREVEETNRHLEQRVAERTSALLHRTQELGTLLEVGRSVNSTLELRPLLEVILRELRHVVEYDVAHIFRIEGDTLHRLHGVPPDFEDPVRVPERWPLKDAAHHRLVVERREAVLIPYTMADTPEARAMREAAAAIPLAEGTPSTPYSCALLLAPLIVRDRIIGTLSIRHHIPGFFTPRHAELATAVANLAAAAIENADRFAAAPAAAAEEERRRLARELHDSVSQALFAADATAGSVPELWEVNPDEGRQALADLRRMTSGAQAEMRALLVELRPEALTRAPLHQLLQTLAAATRSKTGVAVAAHLEEVPALPDDVQVALYRIVQEALQNVYKHASATHVVLRLYAADGVALDITDDGRGFDPDQDASGGLGLATMRERAESIGATLTLESRPGGGTVVAVHWPGVAGRPQPAEAIIASPAL